MKPKIDTGTFDFLGAYTIQATVEEIEAFHPKINKMVEKIQQLTMGLPEEKKPYVSEVLVSYFCGRIESASLALQEIHEYCLTGRKTEITLIGNPQIGYTGIQEE